MVYETGVILAGIAVSSLCLWLIIKREIAERLAILDRNMAGAIQTTIEGLPLDVEGVNPAQAMFFELLRSRFAPEPTILERDEKGRIT